MSNLLSQASLVMIPSGYKEDVVYSPVPTDGSGDLSFTRASNGTRINSAGLVEVVPWNFIEYSEQFTNAAWATSNGATVSADQTTAPNGTTTADKIVFPANSAANIYNFPSSPIGANNISIYAKTLSGTKQFRLRIDTGSGPAVSSNFTATTEWQRFDFAVTTTATNLVAYVFNDSVGVAGDLYVWGAQLNIGSTAKPYFPTTDRLNVPRLTYQNGGGGCPSLLLEKQSTNLITYSEQFDNAAWSKSNVTITANNTTSPDGTQNADLSTATAGGELLQGVVLSTSTSYTFSFYVKKGTASDAKYRVYNFDAGVNVVAPTSYISQTSTSDWVRVVVSFTTGATGTNYGIYLLDQTSAGTMYFYGAQLEASSYATSYIPTTSSSATRVADACYKTGISSLIGQTSGALFVQFNSSFLESYTQRIFTLSDGTSNNVIGFQLTGANQVTFYVENSGVNQVAITKSAPAITLGTNVKIAAAYANNDFVFYINGTQIGTDTSGSVPATSQLRFSEGNASAFYLGLIQQVCLFKTRLTNAELASITSL